MATRKRGRPKGTTVANGAKNSNRVWTPTDEQRRMVEAMSAFGMPHYAIAPVLRISDTTLGRHFRLELDIGLAKANMKVAQFLFQGIVGSENQAPFQNEGHRMVAAMFWLKCRAGWKETITHEVIKPVAEMSDEEIQARLQVEDRYDQDRQNVVPLRKRHGE
jgi:hypothetical protein